MGWLSSLVSIIDKLTPGRKEALVQKLTYLEKQHARLIVKNKAIEAAKVRKQMKEIKRRLENL